MLFYCPFVLFLTTGVHLSSVKESDSDFSLGLVERHRILEGLEVYN